MNAGKQAIRDLVMQWHRATARPFVETKGQLIRLYFINARDLNEAIQVASKMPQARGGPIEVRPVMDFD